MSSGITHPFGWLSRSPGYVSDSLLSRSPLGIATPCDLHVLATPPAFRLSQDQTLQLNFLARAHPDARCDPCGLTGTDTFMTAFIHETSLSKPSGFRRSPDGCYCPSPAKARGQLASTHRFRRAFTRCKAQTSSMAYSNKMIKEDHLLACTTRTLEIQARATHPPNPKARR